MNLFPLDTNLVIGGCLVALVLALAVILGVRMARRPRRRPGIRPPSLASGSPRLESVGLSAETFTFALKPKGTIIGRDEDNDLVVTADLPHWETVSRRHARVYQQDGRWIVEDLGSLNGVYVNGRRTGHNILRDGWRLQLGEVEFVFRASPGETRR